MDRFTLRDFNELLSVTQSPSVSLLMPTYQKGAQTRQNSIRFKNLLHKARQQMDELSFPKAATVLLDEVKPLLDNSFFWRNQSHGLAVFLSGKLEKPRVYRLPISLPEQAILSTGFHLKPLLPMIVEDTGFFMLTLSQGKVRLYRCTRFTIEELEIADMPEDIADALRFDDPERQLQFHTKAEAVRGMHIRGSIHFGTGGISDQDKENIQRYFRIIDEAVRPALHDRMDPLIPVGIDFLLPIYAAVNSYPHLIAKGISYNPQEADPEQLRDRCWQDIMAGLHRRQMKQAVAKYNDLKGTGRTADTIETIMPAAAQGRIDRLIAVLDTPLWGRYNAETNQVTVHERHQPGDRDLIDLAASETLNNSGRVFGASAEDLPDQLLAAAVLRY
jgi:hypothetical protein